MPKSVNKVIKALIANNFFLYSAWGFITPIFAIFILGEIQVLDAAEAAEVAGFAFFTYWMSKSLFQIPFSRYMDKRAGEKDDFWFMVLGLSITALIPLGFLIISLPWHIYVLQLIHGLGMALFIPAWNAVFTRHIDKGREAFEWGMDSTCLGIGTAITGAIGGILAATIGFKTIFVLTSILGIISVVIVLLVHKNILPKDHILSWLPKPRPF